MTFDALACWGTLVAGVLTLLPLLFAYVTKLQNLREQKSFAFTLLPRELRDVIYEELIDDNICYPSEKRLRTSFSLFERILSRGSSKPTNTNLIMLANRQIYREFSEIACKNAKFTLSLDQQNLEQDKFWCISKDILKDMRRCEVKMITTSSMLGAADPRHIPIEWPLCRKVCDTLSICEKLEDASLHVKAIGDPLWNPLWLWFHVSQNFKSSESSKFNKITFGLDSISPGENHLARRKNNLWEWRCPSGHHVMPDSHRKQPIREFCHSLYSECQECILDIANVD